MSPLVLILGQSFAHVAALASLLSVCALLQVTEYWRIVSLAPAIVTAHYSNEYRKHLTGQSGNQVGMVSLSEQLVIYKLLHLIAALAPSSNLVFINEVNLGGGMSIKELLIMVATLAGCNFNVFNIVSALFESSDFMYALNSLIPLAAFFLMLHMG